MRLNSLDDVAQAIRSMQVRSAPLIDVTPASLVSALISERGTCVASREGLLTLYPEERDG